MRPFSSHSAGHRIAVTASAALVAAATRLARAPLARGFSAASRLTVTFEGSAYRTPSRRARARSRAWRAAPLAVPRRRRRRSAPRRRSARRATSSPRWTQKRRRLSTIAAGSAPSASRSVDDRGRAAGRRGAGELRDELRRRRARVVDLREGRLEEEEGEGAQLHISPRRRRRRRARARARGRHRHAARESELGTASTRAVSAHERLIPADVLDEARAP